MSTRSAATQYTALVMGMTRSSLGACPRIGVWSNTASAAESA